MVKEEESECRGDRLPLRLVDRFEECLVGGDHVLERLPGDVAAPRGEADQHPAPVGRIGRAANEPGSFESVEARVIAPVVMSEDRARSVGLLPSWSPTRRNVFRTSKSATLSPNGWSTA